MAYSAIVGSFNIDTTKTAGQTQAVTGVGFTPKVVLFWWSGTARSVDGVAGETAYPGFGAMSGLTSRFAINGRAADAAATTDTQRASHTAAAIALTEDGTTLTGAADFSSFDADGFTLVMDTQFTEALLVSYLALGGTDLTNVYTGVLTRGTAGGTNAYTGVGFQPDCLLTAKPYTENFSAVAAQHLCLGLGWATGATNQGTISVGSVGGGASSDTYGYGYDGECASTIYTSPQGRDSFASFDADGFTLNNLENNGGQFGVVCLKGGQYKVGQLTTRTDGNDIAETEPGFQPVALMFMSANRALSTQNAATAHARWSIGAATSISNRATQAISDEDNLADSEVATLNNALACYGHVIDDAVEALMDIKSIDATGFTAVMDDVETAGCWVTYLAIGAAAGGVTVKPRSLLTLGVGC